MSKPTHVLVGTDFSGGAEVALEVAFEQARAFGARVTIVHAYPAALDLMDPKGIAKERMEIGTEVHRLLAGLKDRYNGQVKALHTEVIPSESPVDALCQYATGHDVDLIVVGAQGHTGLAPFLVGSTAERVARHAPCSVLLAR
ncbi:MAG: universal stress protein [Myxococcales bacterium]|nr:universal stress protein [Myxococcales bacterium]